MSLPLLSLLPRSTDGMGALPPPAREGKHALWPCPPTGRRAPAQGTPPAPGVPPAPSSVRGGGVTRGVTDEGDKECLLMLKQETTPSPLPPGLVGCYLMVGLGDTGRVGGHGSGYMEPSRSRGWASRYVRVSLQVSGQGQPPVEVHGAQPQPGVGQPDKRLSRQREVLDGEASGKSLSGLCRALCAAAPPLRRQRQGGGSRAQLRGGVRAACLNVQERPRPRPRAAPDRLGHTHTHSGG